jgi:hypothetical protein
MGEFRPSRPGERRGGRKAGVPNKMTIDLKEAIIRAADEAKQGGKVEYLKWLAINNSSAFAMLLGKVLPLTIVGGPSRPLMVETSDVSATRRAEKGGIASGQVGVPEDAACRSGIE